MERLESSEGEASESTIDLESVTSVEDSIEQPTLAKIQHADSIDKSELDIETSSIAEIPEDYKSTARTARSYSYTLDFEEESYDPRGAISEVNTARTLRTPSVAYSSDFEASTTWRNSKFGTRYPQDSFDSYTPDLTRSFGRGSFEKSYSTETFFSDSDTVTTERYVHIYKNLGEFVLFFFVFFSNKNV